MNTRNRPHGRSLVVATIALFVALGGTAGAVASTAVPLAKRALFAEKAKVATTAKLATTSKFATRAKTAPTASTAVLAQNTNAVAGQTSAQIIATAATAIASQAVTQSPPGARPASSAAGLVQYKRVPVTLGPDEVVGVTVNCSPLRPVHGGYSTNDGVVGFDSFPATNGQDWNILLGNPDSVNAASAIVHISCLG